MIKSNGLKINERKNFIYFICVIVPCFVAFKKYYYSSQDTRTSEENSQAHSAITYVVSLLSMPLTKNIHFRQNNNIKMYHKIPQAIQHHNRLSTVETKHCTQNCCYWFVSICCFND